MASTFSGWQSISDSGHFDNYTIRDYVLPTTSTSEETSNTADVGGFDNENGNESHADPVREPDADGLEIALFFELELVPTEPKDDEGGKSTVHGVLASSPHA